MLAEPGWFQQKELTLIEESVIMGRFLILFIFFMMLAQGLYAQDESESLLVGGRPLENVIVDRDLAFRLRAELRLTDDDDVIDDDVNYSRFPSRMYSSSAAVFQDNGLKVSATYSLWENNQDMETHRWGWGVRVPLNNTFKMYVKYNEVKEKQKDDELEDLKKHYSYIAGSFSRGSFYNYTQYRYRTEANNANSHQIYEYVSWRFKNSLLLGGYAAISKELERDDSWYVSVFSTIPIIKKFGTYLRVKSLHYEYSSDLQWEKYEVFLYQKILGQSLLRLGYRFYQDSDDLFSNGYGIKLKHYFSPKFSTHIGYRFYDHSEDVDLDTAYTGFSLLF
ncbi:hypothetical protein ACFLS1_12015 [Verrucomicrobiota bacterium]